jgi:hypothetical protein
MTHFNHFQELIEQAETLSNGLKVFKAGEQSVMIWKPGVIKPTVNYTFKTSSLMEYFIKDYSRKYDESLNDKVQRNTFKHELKVGDIMVSSWGYEQTNVDFYQVTKTTLKSVWVREISKLKGVEGDSSMAGKVMPIKDDFKGPEKRFLVNEYGIRIESYASAKKWDGKPQYFSDYA